jgi:hypothetical protein
MPKNRFICVVGMTKLGIDGAKWQKHQATMTSCVMSRAPLVWLRTYALFDEVR